MTAEEVEKALRTSGQLSKVVDAAWPSVTPERLVRRCSRSPRAPGRGRGRDPRRRPSSGCCCATARGGGERWSDHDLPLARRGGRARRRAAADVRPRDRRRGAGPLADAAADGRAAQRGAARTRSSATSRRRPASVTVRELGRRPARTCRDGDRAEVEELRHAYRVPREIMELALPLLDTIAPGRRAAGRLPPGGEAPRLLHEVPDGRAAARGATTRRRGSRARTGLARLIAPTSCSSRARRTRAPSTRHPAAARRARPRASSSTT